MLLTGLPPGPGEAVSSAPAALPAVCVPWDAFPVYDAPSAPPHSGKRVHGQTVPRNGALCA